MVKAPPVAPAAALPDTLTFKFLPPVTVVVVAAELVSDKVMSVVAAALTVVLLPVVPTSETVKEVRPDQPCEPEAVLFVSTVNVSPEEMMAV